MESSNRWRRFRTLLIAASLLGLVAVSGLLFACYSCANPSDRVFVSINHIPEGTCFACVAYQSNGDLRTIRWYSTDGLLTLAWDPYTWHWSYRDPHDPDASWGKIPAKWVAAERYGVVTMTTDRVWRITWFAPEEMQVVGASALSGGGTVILDLSKGETVPLTKEDVSSLELQW